MTERDKPQDSALLTGIGFVLSAVLLQVAVDAGGTVALVSTAAALMLGLYGSSLAVRSGSLAESIKQLSVMVPGIALGLWAVWKDFGWREILLLFLVVGLLALIVEKAIRMAGALWRDHHSTYR